MDTKMYKTKDLAESSYLLIKNQKIIAIERAGSTCWFVFTNKDICKKLANDFWFGNAVGNIKEYFEALQTLKNRIFAGD